MYVLKIGWINMYIYMYILKKNQSISNRKVIWEMYVAKPWIINVKSDWPPLFTISTKQIYYSNAFLSRGLTFCKTFLQEWISLFHLTRVCLLVRTHGGIHIYSLPILFCLDCHRSLSQVTYINLPRQCTKN